MSGRTCRTCIHCVLWRERVNEYARMGRRMPKGMPDSVCLANWKVPFPVCGMDTAESRECERYERRTR